MLARPPRKYQKRQTLELIDYLRPPAKLAFLTKANKSLGGQESSQVENLSSVSKQPSSTELAHALDSDRRSGKRANKQRLPTH